MRTPILLALALTLGCRTDDEVPEDTGPHLVDTDGDGVSDEDDAFPDDPSETTDTDDDGVGDNADNCVDAANDDQLDTDGDALGDVCDDDDDGDGVLDDEDNCPLVDNDQADLDEDGLGDACDDDLDGDGTANADDAFPTDATESTDTDDDGVGDNADAFPEDPSESMDTDDDGVGDNGDNCVEVANGSQLDLDEDGTGDACDTDADGDGEASLDAGGPDCDDLDPTATSTSGCRPEPVEPSPDPVDLTADQPNGIADLRFLPDGRAVMCTIISGLDYVYVYAADGTQETIDGASTHNMGAVAVSPVDDRVVVSYTNVGMVGWEGDSNIPVVASGTTTTSPYFTRTYVSQAATSIVVDETDTAWVPNLDGVGTLVPVTRDGGKGAAIDLGSYIESVALGPDGALYATLGADIHLVDRDAGTSSVWDSVPDPILDLEIDYNGVAYVETTAGEILRLGLDGAQTVFQEVTEQGKLAISPDGKLYRLIPRPVGKAGFERWDLPD